MGILAAKLAEVKGGAVNNVHMMLRGALFNNEDCSATPEDQLRPHTIAMLKGLLEVSLGAEVSYMLAPILAKKTETLLLTQEL